MGGKVAQLTFLAGIIMLLLALITGEGKGGIFIIFPFFYGSGIFSMAGMLLIFLSLALFIFSFPERMLKENDIPEMEKERRAGGIIFIGPIPIIFSTDESMGKTLVIISMLIIILFLLIFLLLY